MMHTNSNLPVMNQAYSEKNCTPHAKIQQMLHGLIVQFLSYLSVYEVNSSYLFFSIWVFFHGHSRFTGQ